MSLRTEVSQDCFCSGVCQDSRDEGREGGRVSSSDPTGVKGESSEVSSVIGSTVILLEDAVLLPR